MISQMFSYEFIIVFLKELKLILFDFYFLGKLDEKSNRWKVNLNGGNAVRLKQIVMEF